MGKDNKRGVEKKSGSVVSVTVGRICCYFKTKDGIRAAQESRGLGNEYRRKF